MGLFTWNARTGQLDALAERTGLEFISYVLSPVAWVSDKAYDLWNRYIALIDVAEENAYLREELHKTRISAILNAEEKAELDRLRSLLQVDALNKRPGIAARVIAKRFGPKAVLKTFTVNKGYLDGAIVGTPVITDRGVVGRVLRTSPHAATVITLTDPGFRLAVISRESRTPGILSGTNGPEPKLEVAYVAQTAHISPGDTLITSGMDGSFPKGLPVGIVTNVSPGSETLFQQIQAHPLVDVDYIEEVILLQQENDGPPLLGRLQDPIGTDPNIPPESILLPIGSGGMPTSTLPGVLNTEWLVQPAGKGRADLPGTVPGPSTTSADINTNGLPDLDDDAVLLPENALPANSNAPGLLPGFMQRNATGANGPAATN